MNDIVREIKYDEDLAIEALRLQGIAQKFAAHFHDYYVIGIVKDGKRSFECNQGTYHIKKGDIVLMNPNDIHSCYELSNSTLTYFALNVSKETVYDYFHYYPQFNIAVFKNENIAELVIDLYNLIYNQANIIIKQKKLNELFRQLSINKLLENDSLIEIPNSIIIMQDYLEINYHRKIKLDSLVQLTNISKYHLIRLFNQYIGTTPYNYLETIRIIKAKELLINGISVIEVANKIGYSDQSHFSNHFKKTMGLNPSQYISTYKK